ncbi:MAG: class I SAM-dependent methyltransferase [Chromatiales bacterium]|nr:class I SAM-dependent methyltransferase [Chromatiales bacterium]
MSMYTRENPSPEYLEMVRMYETLHEEGEASAGKSAKQTFPGKMLIRHAPGIKEMIDRTGAKTILDYGAGKGLGYTLKDVQLTKSLKVASIQDYWDVDEIRCYDPGYEPFSELPTQQYDGVISTDVLEHITEPDVPWVIDEMFSLARKFVYANIACYPAVKLLPNGQNAHCTVRPPQWWAGVVHAIAMRHTGVSYRLIMSTATGPRKKFGFAKNRKKVYHTVERMV